MLCGIVAGIVSSAAANPTDLLKVIQLVNIVKIHNFLINMSQNTEFSNIRYSQNTEFSNKHDSQNTEFSNKHESKCRIF